MILEVDYLITLAKICVWQIFSFMWLCFSGQTFAYGEASVERLTREKTTVLCKNEHGK